MSTLTEFLLERIAEDEEAARLGISSQADPENGWGYEGRALTPHVGIIHEAAQAAHIIRWHPARVLAECEAKRQIVRLHRLVDTDPYASWKDERYLKRYPPLLACCLCKTIRQLPSGGREWPCETLRLMALVYSDHPDFNPSWGLP